MSKRHHPDSESLQSEAECETAQAESFQGAPTEENPEEDLKRQLTELQTLLETAQAEAAEAKETLLRKVADLENSKKRLQAEKEKSVRLANKALLTDLLEVLDNFDRAFSAAAAEESSDAIVDGVKLIENQLVSLLDNKYDVKAFESVGELFDPEKHEAIALGEASENGEQIILNEYQKGYTWGESILRTAKVIVSAPGNK